MRLGRYELVRRLARGELTELWLARLSGAAEFERYVVIKQVREDRARDAVFVQSFMTEARVAGALHHHNIVQVQDIGEDGGRHYLVMEYVHGESLRHVLARLHERQESMPLQHVLAIIGAVASALHHAHEVRGADRQPAGIVHRAVTPGNIIVGYDGNVKVLDFGIAKAAMRTAEGTLIGSKVPYMAPEECTGQTVDRRADVFALGVVFHEAVTGRRLFRADTDFLTMSAIARGAVPRPSHYRKDLPQPLESVIMKALARAPGERYQTADELRLALEPIATQLAAGIVPSALAAYMKELFEGRGEPWHDEQELVIAPIDFDGRIRGLAAPPGEAVDAFALPTGTAKDAPLTQARTRAITDTSSASQPPPVVTILPRRARSEPIGPEAAVPAPVDAAHEPTAVVAPLPIEGTMRSPRRPGRYRRLTYLAASALVATAGVIVFLSMTSSSTSSAPVVDHVSRAVPSTDAATAETPPVSEPKVDPPELMKGSGHVAEPAHIPKRTHRKPVVKRAVKRPDPATPKDWDPDSLFYGKKPSR